MSFSFTISSPLSEFTTLTYTDGLDIPNVITNRPTGGEVVRFEWRGSRAAAIETSLRAIAIPAGALVNGQPEKAMSGRSYAQTLSTGYLARVQYQHANSGPSVDQTGILVVLSSQVGPGGPNNHSLQVALYPMTAGSRLYYADASFAEVPA